MNWDWDKLQEKRKQQNTWDFGKKINNTPEPEEDFGFDAETEKKNFEEFFKKISRITTTMEITAITATTTAIITAANSRTSF